MVSTGDCRRAGIDMALRMGEVLYMGGREGKRLPSRRKGAIRSGDLLLGKKTTRNRKEAKHTALGL